MSVRSIGPACTVGPELPCNNTTVLPDTSFNVVAHAVAGSCAGDTFLAGKVEHNRTPPCRHSQKNCKRFKDQVLLVAETAPDNRFYDTDFSVWNLVEICEDSPYNMGIWVDVTTIILSLPSI